MPSTSSLDIGHVYQVSLQSIQNSINSLIDNIYDTDQLTNQLPGNRHTQNKQKCTEADELKPIKMSNAKRSGMIAG